METLVIIFAIMFWVLLALACFCLCSICYIKLTYMKWDKEDKEKERITKLINSVKNSE